MRSETTNTTRSPQDLGQHIQVLTQVLQGIAGSIGMAPAFVDAPQFFYNYMYGDWHPYMEASEPATADLKARNQNVLHLVNYLESLLPKEAHRKVEEYIDAVNNRYTAELDYAYMVGFQTAFRMMLLGITDAFEKRLRMEIRSKHSSMVNADTACHQLYGFKVALEQLGLLDESKCFVYPDHFKEKEADNHG